MKYVKFDGATDASGAYADGGRAAARGTPAGWPGSAQDHPAQLARAVGAISQTPRSGGPAGRDRAPPDRQPAADPVRSHARLTFRFLPGRGGDHGGGPG